jgi:hypothetical protein
MECLQTNKVYEEKAPYSNTIKLVMVSGLFSLAFLYFILRKPEQAEFALLLVVLISALITWSFFNIKFRITTDGVEAAMPPFTYRIPFSEIKSVKLMEDIPWYAGWGMRLWWGGGIAFISMRKSAVLIEKEKGFFRKLILTTQNPDDFIKKLNEGMNTFQQS